MIRAIAIAILLLPATARAQLPSDTDPVQLAFGQMLLEATQREASLRAQLIVAERKLRAAEAAKADPPKPTAPGPHAAPVLPRAPAP